MLKPNGCQRRPRCCALLLLGAIGLTFCKPNESLQVHADTSARLDWLLKSKSEDSLVLIAIALRDTVQRGGPVEVAYFVRNDGEPSALRHDTDFIDFDVIGPSGVVSKVGAIANVYAGRAAEVTLPTRGILGQVVDLACVKFLYSPAAAPCYYEYPFREAGEYQIVVRYAPPQLSPETTGQATQRAGGKWQPLSSDTIRVVVR